MHLIYHLNLSWLTNFFRLRFGLFSSLHGAPVSYKLVSSVGYTRTSDCKESFCACMNPMKSSFKLVWLARAAGLKPGTFKLCWPTNQMVTTSKVFYKNLFRSEQISTKNCFPKRKFRFWGLKGHFHLTSSRGAFSIPPSLIGLKSYATAMDAWKRTVFSSQLS